MPEPVQTTEQVDDALKLAKDAQALLDRAKELGADLPPEFEEQANAFIALDAPKTTNIAKALALDEAAGEAQILTAIGALKQAPDLKVLEAHAANHGKVLLDADTVAQLEARAAAGDKAKGDLHEQRFGIAYDKALFEGRVDAKPETKQLHRQLFEASPELALQNLASLPRTVNVLPQDASLKVLENSDADVDAPDGVDPERFQLDQKAKAYMADKGLADNLENYLTAVEAVS